MDWDSAAEPAIFRPLSAARLRRGDVGGEPSFLAGAVASFTSAATDQADVPDLLSNLAEIAATHLPIDGAGVMLANGANLKYVHADAAGGFLPPVDRCERLQEQLQCGPCHDAFSMEREILVTDLLTCSNSAWHGYLDGARSAGVRSIAAVPCSDAAAPGGSSTSIGSAPVGGATPT